jgi:hypothetical protein
MCFPTIGCTKKIRKALAKTIVANRAAEGDDMGAGSLLGFSN